LYLIAGQAFVALAQLIYSGGTSRAFEPRQIGEFAVAMSATGVLTILFASGLPSFALSSTSLGRSQLRTLTAIAAIGGLAAGLIMFFFGGAWCALWNAPGGSRFIPLLAMQVAISPAAGLFLAVRRREGRAARDAVIQTGSALAGLTIGATFVIASGAPETLAVSPLAFTVITLLWSLVAGRGSTASAVPKISDSDVRVRTIVAFTSNIALQSMFFFFLTTMPMWAVSLSANKTDLGFYSRAVLITEMSFYALSNALNRALQPFHHQFGHDRKRAEAISDSLLAAGALSMPGFFCLAALSTPFVYVWLGNDWSPVSSMMVPMACGFGLYVMFAVATNACELTRNIAIVRRCQLLMLVPSSIMFAAVIVFRKPILASFSILIVGIFGMTTIIRLMRRSGLLPARADHPILRQAAYSCLIAVAAGIAAAVVLARTESAPIALIAGSLLALCLQLSTFRSQPVGKLAARRGLTWFGLLR
jgi:O-antigen/teichoic acid export membrane protein